MGAFQWGVLLSAICAAARFPSRADEGNGAAILGAIAAAALVILIFVGAAPYDLQVFFGNPLFFPIGAVLFWLPLHLFFRDMVARHKVRRAKKLEEQKAVQALAQAQRDTAISNQASFFDNAMAEWPVNVQCTSDGKAALLANVDLTAIRLVRYIINDEFSVTSDYTVPIDDIISVRTRPTYTTRLVTRTELVPVSITNKKSPVGRAIVGGLIAGPAGIVVGAASGLGGKSTIQNEERRVTEQVQAPGPPMLVIGTIHQEYAVINLQFKGDNTADEWLHQLEAAKARSQRTGRLR